MEIQRILARDTKTATDKAIAQFGPEVLIITNNRVNGQTELLVAADITLDDDFDTQPQTEPDAKLPRKPKNGRAQVHQADSVQAQMAKSLNSFEAAFEETMLQRQQARLAGKKPAQTMQSVERSKQQAPLLKPVEDARPKLTQAETGQPAVAPTPATRQEPNVDFMALQAERDAARSREIVDLVRDEIAALRREFSITQRMNPWQDALPIAPAVKPLIAALGEAGVPAGLRGLLIDRIRETQDLEEAIVALSSHLLETLPKSGVDMPEQGVHVICGPTGVGKSLMAARLAQAGALAHGTHNVAVVSFADNRPGAWSQMQMLAAQTGVECFRAHDASGLALLADELANRKLLVVDTAGVQFERTTAHVHQVLPKASLHAVIAADASSVTIRRVREAFRWTSLMVSKLDEATQPWPLIQALCDSPLPVSMMSPSERLSEAVLPYAASQIVTQALTHLQIGKELEPLSKGVSIEDRSFGAATLTPQAQPAPPVDVQSMTAQILQLRAAQERNLNG